jgi:hypothetical protein
VATHSKTETERQLAEGREGGWDGGGVKSYDDEKVWSSINHYILSGWTMNRLLYRLHLCRSFYFTGMEALLDASFARYYLLFVNSIGKVYLSFLNNYILLFFVFTEQYY